jgi:hypothetical protein
VGVCVSVYGVCACVCVVCVFGECMWLCFDNCVCFGNTCPCVYRVFYVCTVVLYCFVYVYLFLFVLSVIV